MTIATFPRHGAREPRPPIVEIVMSSCTPEELWGPLLRRHLNASMADLDHAMKKMQHDVVRLEAAKP